MSDKLEFSEEGFQQLKRKNRLQLIGVSAIILVTGLFLGKSWLSEEQSQSATADNVDMYTASGVLGSNGITEEQADKLDVGQAVILEPLPGEEENVQQVELNNPLVGAEEAASTPTEASRLPNAAMTTAAVAATAATATAALTPKKDTAVYELKEGQETVTAADPDGGLRTVVKKAEPNAHYDGAPLPVVTISSAKVDNKEQVLTLQEKATTPTEVKKVETPVETTKVVETKTAVEKKQQTEVAAKQQAEAKKAERAEEAKRVAEQKRQAELKAKQQAEVKRAERAEEAKRVAEQKRQAELKAKQQAEAKRAERAEEAKRVAEQKRQAELKAKQQAEVKREARAEEAKRVAEQKRQAELKAKQQAEAKRAERAEEAKRVVEQKRQAELKAKQQAEAKREARAEEAKRVAEQKRQAELKAKQQAEAKRAERAEEAKRVAEQKRQAELKAKQQAEAKKAEEAKRVAEQKKQAELKAKQQAEAKRKAAADKAQAALNNQSGKQSANPKAILNGEQSGKAIVQAGAYTSESQAKQIQQRLAQAGIKTHINEFNTAKGTTLYRVRTGSYPNRAAANQALGRIRMQGVEGKIIGQP